MPRSANSALFVKSLLFMYIYTSFNLQMKFLKEKDRLFLVKMKLQYGSGMVIYLSIFVEKTTKSNKRDHTLSTLYTSGVCDPAKVE